MPDVRTGRRPRLDLVGVLLASAGLAAVVYGVIDAGPAPGETQAEPAPIG